MNPIRSLQSDPARARDLFAQLAATGPGAAKTRERLFAELKAELELHARLEHDHLLPVLKKHAETRALVPNITEGLKTTAALLAEIEALPREGDDFIARVAELKTAFQRHLRDEKNELLPAVRKALSEEETRTVAEKIAADREQVEQAAAEAAERERTARREQREAAQRIEAAAEEAEAATRKGVAETRRVARAAQETARARMAAGQETMESGLRAVQNLGQRSVERFSEALTAQQQSTEALTSAARCGTVMVQGWREAAREWSGFAQSQQQGRVQAVRELMTCRTPWDVYALQARLVQDGVQSWFAAAGRVAEITSGTAGETARTLTPRA